MLITKKLLIQTRVTCRMYCAIALLALPVFGTTNSTDSSPAAPVPISIETAHKVFISNAPGDSVPDSLGGPAGPYNEFYEAIKSWGRYQLVSAPADADLVFEISFANPIVGVNVMSTSGGGSRSDLLLKVVIVDPKTHVPLWWFTESFALKGGFSHRKETLDSNFHRAIATLVDDVRKLVETPAKPN